MAMRVVVLPMPPNPNDAQYRGNTNSYNQAVYQWMVDMKGKLEAQSRQNDPPIGQSFAVSSYTTNTSLSGTSTGTDVANFVCSLIAAMQTKGLVKPV